MKAWFKPLLASSLCALTLSACSTFDGDDNELVPAELVDFKPQFEAKKLWSGSCGGGVGDFASRLAPALAGDVVYAASREGQVCAFDKSSGDKLWQVHLGDKKANHWFAGHYNAMLSGGLTATESQIFVGSEHGFVYALNAATGEQNWKVAVEGEALAPPMVAKGIVVVNTLSGRVYGLDEASGEQKWRFDNVVPPLTLRGLGAPAIASGGVFMGTPDGRLNVLTLEQGYQAWELQITQPEGSNDLERLVDVDADAKIEGDTVYAVAYNGDLIAVDIRNGQEKWKRPYSSYQGMTLEGFSIYLSNSSSYVYAIDRREGRELWANLQLENRQITTPAFVNRYAVVGDRQGYLHWLDANTGEFAARMRVDSDGVYTAPVVDGAVMYIQSRDGDLYAIETP